MKGLIIPVQSSKAWPACVLAAAFAVSGCVDLRPERTAPPTGELPKGFIGARGKVARSERWWRAFGNDELSAAVERALAGNLTLRSAWARLDQARAAARKAGAALSPSVDAEAGASHRRSEVKGRTSTGESFAVGLAAAYEVDLWGRIRSEHEAAMLDVHAAREDLDAAAVTLAATVSDVWFRILEKRADTALLRKQLDSNQTSLELLELRFRKSRATILDVEQQRQIVAGVAARIPLAESDERALWYELALLTGKPAPKDVEVRTANLPALPPRPEEGLPASLIGRRPDVRAALRRLQAADHRVAAARADRLPAVRLAGSTSLESDKLDDVLSSWYLNLAANLAAPLVDGGRRRAEVDRTRAVVGQRLAEYRLAVLTAIKEVEEALVRERKQEEHIAALERQIGFARRSLVEARQRYLKGSVDYLRVLTALISVQDLEREMIKRRRELLGFRIDLYRALGGGWPLIRPEPEASPSPQTHERPSR